MNIDYKIEEVSVNIKICYKRLKSFFSLLPPQGFLKTVEYLKKNPSRTQGIHTKSTVDRWVAEQGRIIFGCIFGKDNLDNYRGTEQLKLLIQELYKLCDYIVLFETRRFYSGLFLCIGSFIFNTLKISEVWNLKAQQILTSIFATPPQEPHLFPPNVWQNFVKLWCRFAEEQQIVVSPQLKAVAQGDYLKYITKIPYTSQLVVVNFRASQGVSKPTAIENIEHFFSLINLEYPGLQEVKRYIEQKDYSSALRSYKIFSKQKFKAWIPQYLKIKGIKLLCDRGNEDKRAEEICRNIFLLRAHMYVKHNFGSKVDWYKILFDNLESNVAINGFDNISYLAQAFIKTGIQKYGAKIIELLNSWIRENPVPNNWWRGFAWRTLEVGARAGVQLPLILSALYHYDKFWDDFFIRFIISYIEHMHYLVGFHSNSGNWFQVETAGLGVCGVLFPELKVSPSILYLAHRRLSSVNRTTYLKDGFHSEASPHYHCFPTAWIANFVLLSKLNGFYVPKALDDLLKKILNVVVYISTPDMRIPVLNDGNTGPEEIDDMMYYYKYFVNKEVGDYFLSRRERGKPPSHTSYCFPEVGYCVMRDNWTEQSIYLVFDGGFWGTGHQHEDKLNFILWAYGRELICDPGIYHYAYDHKNIYWRSTRGHNGVLVDGKGQSRRLSTIGEVPDSDFKWVFSKDFSFCESWYRDGFATHSLSAGGYQRSLQQDRDTLEKDIAHRRGIFYIKGEYFIVIDHMVKEGKNRTANFDQLFHLAPVIKPTGGLEPGTFKEIENGIVTTNRGVSNIAILSAAKVDISAFKAQEKPFRGWRAYFAEVPAWEIVLSLSSEFPLQLLTLLYPMKPGTTSFPKITRTDYGVKIEFSTHVDHFFICEKELKAEKVECKGGTFYIREKQNRVIKAAGIKGEYLRIGDKEIKDPIFCLVF